MNDIPATIDLNPKGDSPKASVIWLHGLGADGSDFVPIVEQLGLSEKSKVRFVFPHAPVRSITVNGGMRMRGWYDIAELDVSEQEDEKGIEDSDRLLRLLIEREKGFGIKSNRIALAGFSQGGAMSLYTGLRFPEPLAGIVALSTYLLLPGSFVEARDPANYSTPIFMAHGLFDPIIPLALGQKTRQQLEGCGYSVDWHSYPMPHSILPEEIADIGSFLRKIL